MTARKSPRRSEETRPDASEVREMGRNLSATRANPKAPSAVWLIVDIAGAVTFGTWRTRKAAEIARSKFLGDSVRRYVLAPKKPKKARRKT